MLFAWRVYSNNSKAQKRMINREKKTLRKTHTKAYGKTKMYVERGTKTKKLFFCHSFAAAIDYLTLFFRVLRTNFFPLFLLESILSVSRTLCSFFNLLNVSIL